MSMPQPKIYEIPQGANLSKCRSCKADIYWGLTDNNKNVPLNLDGTSHYTTCPDAKKWSLKK